MVKPNPHDMYIVAIVGIFNSQPPLLKIVVKIVDVFPLNMVIVHSLTYVLYQRLEHPNKTRIDGDEWSFTLQ